MWCEGAHVTTKGFDVQCIAGLTVVSMAEDMKAWLGVVEDCIGVEEGTQFGMCGITWVYKWGFHTGDALHCQVEHHVQDKKNLFF